LNSGSKERKLVEEYKDKAPLSVYEDEIREGEFEIKKRIGESKNFFDKRKSLHKDIEDVKKRISSLNDNLRFLEKKRKGLKEEEIESLVSIREFQFSEVEKYDKKLGEINTAIETAKNCEKICEEKARKMEKENIKNKEMKKKYDICDTAITFLENIEDNLLKEVKEEVEKRMDSICKAGLKNEDRLDKIIINDDFELQILKKNKFGGGSMYEDLSQGQKEILATSFIIALRKESGFDSPIFFDFPFGKLDPEKGKELIESLKQILKDVQVNFLLIGNREFGEFERDLMKDRLGTIYEIKKVPDEPRSEVIKK
jgi:DNA sulfur modification protein DndD